MVPGTRAGLAEADWASDELRNEPHVALGCGHLSRPGSGPLAEAGFGYCRHHGVTRIVAEPRPGKDAEGVEQGPRTESAAG